MAFIFYKQHDIMDCGPTCLRMIAKYHGKSYGLQQLRERTGINREGSSLLAISEAAESIGFRTYAVKISIEQLINEAILPCIIHWHLNHFVVLYKIKRKRGLFGRGKDYWVYLADPGKGTIKYSFEEFLSGWGNTTSREPKGVALLMEPTPKFYEEEADKTEQVSFALLLGYFSTYRKLLIQLLLGLLVGTLLQLVLPFMTQAIVDVGINTQNLNFIYLILAAQLMLFAGRLSVDMIRNWILLHVSTRINVSILSDFLIKLMRLPLSFFDAKQFGDIMQRISDHSRIESFLTNTTLQILFSLFNLVIFGLVLAYYHLTIFAIFLVSSVLYVLWVTLFLKYRRSLDFKNFDAGARNQSNLVQLIQGMQEIKLANSETQKRWEWEAIQARMFKLSIKGLYLTQYQQVGAFFFNEIKTIFITFLAAKAVVEGQMTLGAMMALQYIMGQLNSPIEQFISFMQVFQDAKISLERLNEIHQLPDEEPADQSRLDRLPDNRSLFLRNISFNYPGMAHEEVLKDVELYIPEGKVTAIVGTSGSGKTTLLKLLLKFYEPVKGDIRLGEANLKNLKHKIWRSQCGVVMQDGFIFSDTIARNITIGDEYPDIQKLLNAVQVANIGEFIESLPAGYNTKIGAEGNGISQGQKQRILIARAVYKDPAFMFFDEATNALDANNERTIMDNLECFFKGRTVVVVAHRLSTVKNADQIVVLHKGKITEVGTHAELTNLKREYYQLVKNQLELGN